MKRFCDKKDLFGKPNEGFHQYQAIGDWILTLIGALVLALITWGIAKAFGKELPFVFITFLWFVFLVLLGIFLHYLFCVDTRVSKFLNIS